MKPVNKLSEFFKNLWGTVEEEEEPTVEIIVPTHTTKPLRKFIFRPRNLSEYIGQEKAKALIRLNIKKICNIKPVHILINGNAGHGKTTLAYVIVNELRSKMYSVIGSNFTREALLDFIKANEQDLYNLHILFIDEIHSMSKDMAEVLYPILEDFRQADVDLKPFVMIGATTEKATLIKRFHPLVDRCGCQIHLESYTNLDIEKVLSQYSQQLYEEYLVPIDIIKILSASSKNVPRIAIAMLDDYIVCKDIDMVLSAHRMVKGSLNEIDIQILLCLRTNGKPMGQKNISTKVGIDQVDYVYMYEPFLIKEDYINVTTRGREITPKGTAVLQEIGV